MVATIYSPSLIRFDLTQLLISLRAGGYIDTALQVLFYISKANIPIDSHIYFLVLSICIDTQHIDHGLEICNFIMSNNTQVGLLSTLHSICSLLITLQISTVLLNAMLHTFIKAKQPEQVMELWETMKKKVSPYDRTFSLVLIASAAIAGDNFNIVKMTMQEAKPYAIHDKFLQSTLHSLLIIYDQQKGTFILSNNNQLLK